MAAIDTLNLIYHVTPFADSRAVWRANLRQLLRRIHIFNGKRVVAIATGPEMDPPSEVKRLLGEHVADYLETTNSVKLRERASFMQLLGKVHSLDPGEATFYAHAKGVRSRGNPEGVMYWRNLMYHLLLDEPLKVCKLLERYPTVGSHRRRKPLPDHREGNTAAWHFSGTFFWFRNKALFGRPLWRKIPDTGYGVEGAMGFLFSYQDSCCLGKDDIDDPYAPKSYAPAERFIDEPEAAGVKIEIGGGAAPHGEGYQVVDVTDSADHRFDIATIAAGARLPFADGSVAAVYLNHVLEGVVELRPLMRELMRVSAVGAVIELRTAHWLHNMALCYGHRQVITHEQVDHWVHSALDHWWSGCARRPSLLGVEHVPGGGLHRWKRLLPRASAQDIMELCPEACREVRWKFVVIANT